VLRLWNLRYLVRVGNHLDRSEVMPMSMPTVLAMVTRVDVDGYGDGDADSDNNGDESMTDCKLPRQSGGNWG